MSIEGGANIYTQGSNAGAGALQAVANAGLVDQQTQGLQFDLIRKKLAAERADATRLQGMDAIAGYQSPDDPTAGMAPPAGGLQPQQAPAQAPGAASPLQGTGLASAGASSYHNSQALVNAAKAQYQMALDSGDVSKVAEASKAFQEAGYNHHLLAAKIRLSRDPSMLDQVLGKFNEAASNFGGNAMMQVVKDKNGQYSIAMAGGKADKLSAWEAQEIAATMLSYGAGPALAQARLDALHTGVGTRMTELQRAHDAQQTNVVQNRQVDAQNYATSVHAQQVALQREQLYKPDVKVEYAQVIDPRTQKPVRVPFHVVTQRGKDGVFTTTVTDHTGRPIDPSSPAAQQLLSGGDQSSPAIQHAQIAGEYQRQREKLGATPGMRDKGSDGTSEMDKLNAEEAQRHAEVDRQSAVSKVQAMPPEAQAAFAQQLLQAGAKTPKDLTDRGVSPEVAGRLFQVAAPQAAGGLPAKLGSREFTQQRYKEWMDAKPSYFSQETPTQGLRLRQAEQAYQEALRAEQSAR